MFQSRTTTQYGQKQMMWEDKVVFLLSLSSGEDRIETLTEHNRDDAVIICAQGRIEGTEPCFGPQKYYEAKKGMSYEIAIPEFEKGLAVYQHKDWWVRPAFAEEINKVPDRTQLLLFRQEDCYFVMLAVCGTECRTDICGTEQGLKITVSSNAGNRNRIEDISMVITAGENPYLCCERAVREALQFMGKESMLRRNRKFPSLFEFFGWCSWDAFYHEVSHKGIMKKMQELREKKISIQWVLIDDGWLSADYKDCVLEDFDAGETSFPEGLKGCAKELKEVYGIRYIGVWHAIMGYWNGLKEDSEAIRKLQDSICRLPDGRLMPAPEAGKAFEFFDKWHEYLKNQCGIDFVKVDGQSAISLAYAGLETYGKASREIQKGLNASAALHFNNNIINCMGMASEDMWNRPSSAVSRSSDDFVPEEVNGFREHVIQNGYNSLLQGQFFWSDWDMFYSRHAEGLQNSILRAVSGGPVYISDKTGETDASMILPLIRGDGRVIRCEETGLPTVDCLLENPLYGRKPLKLFNRYKEAYVVAAFSIQEDGQETEGSLDIRDIPGLADKEWLVYRHIEQSTKRLTKSKPVSFRLQAGEAELFLLLPEREGITVIGIFEKYISSGCTRLLWEKKNKAAVLAEEKGMLGFVSERKPVRIMINGTEAAWETKTGCRNVYAVWIEERNSVTEISFME